MLQQKQVYEVTPQVQEYQIPQQNQNYQIYQQNQDYEFDQQVQGNQDYQQMEVNPQQIYQYYQQGQENIIYNNYQMNNITQQQQNYPGNQTVLEPIFFQMNENQQITQNGYQYQVNQGENLYQIISENQENLMRRHYPNYQYAQNYNYAQNQNNQNNQFRQGFHEGKMRKNTENISEEEIKSQKIVFRKFMFVQKNPKMQKILFQNHIKAHLYLENLHHLYLSKIFLPKKNLNLN